jgi:threonylcarbamoyladenosine tRNA methylthiotransferase MtaB
MNPAATFTTRTFGCKVNQYDSQFLAEQLSALGLQFVDDHSSHAGVQAEGAARADGAGEAADPEAAGASDSVDLVVVNTCAVTARSEAKGRRLVRWLLRSYPHATVVLTGCAVRLDARPWEAIGRDRARPDETGRGTTSARLLLVPSPEEVPRRLVEAGLVATGGLSPGPLASVSVPRPSNRTLTPTLSQGERARVRVSLGHPNRISGFLGHDRAFVKVQDGCQALCSYCVVPLVRPVLWSRPADEVVGEVRALAEAGYGEVVLVGVHLGLYGGEASADSASAAGRGLIGAETASPRDDAQGGCRTSSLAGLIRRLLAETDVGRLRLSSIEPQEVTDDLIDLAAESDRLCPHFHLPLQSGDDGVLGAMNRRYTAREYMGILERISGRIPRPAFTTDILLGFPGEGEAEFERTLAAVREARFSRIHAFRYSPRPGTKAATLTRSAPEREVLRREHILLALAGELARSYCAQFLGEVVEVLVEGVADRLASAASPAGTAGASPQPVGRGLQTPPPFPPPEGSNNQVLTESKTQEFLAGLSERYLRVRFPRPDDVRVRPGSLVRVRVLSSDDSGLVGEWEPGRGGRGERGPASPMRAPAEDVRLGE